VTTPRFLLELMNYRALSWNVRLGAEDQEALAFANELRKATLEMRLRAVWTHPANELGWQAKVTPQIAIARALGMINGASDYLFLARDGSMAIEFKTPKGRQSEGQQNFESWCDLFGVPYHVARTAHQGLALLKDRGWLA
jgi:hypothetical protein